MPEPRPASRAAVTVTSALIAGACLMAPVAAQSIDLELKAGVSSTTVTWEPTPLGGVLEDVDRRTSSMGGVSLGLRFPSGIGVRAEVLRVEKGFREVQSNGDRSTLDVAYLEIPLLAGVTVADGGHVEPELYVGPYLSWELSCNVEGEISGSAIAFDCDAIPGDPVLRQTTDWGGVAGVALRIGNAEPLRAVVDLRYAHGFRNVDAAPEVDNLSTRHRGLGAMAGLSVRVGPGGGG